jgi:serine/threonine protein kinase
MSLFYRIQENHIRDQKTMVVIKVEKLEPLSLRKEWMNDLAQAVAFLESLNLAHGDLRPENILLDRNRLKLSDFDSTAEIGTNHEACMAPYGRLLNSNETDQGERGTSGFLGARTEQFALGSLFYFINYGFEVYGDRCLTEDPYEHGPKVVDLLQNMEFPKLDGDPLIDNIIDKCWHNKYVTVSELAAHTKTLLDERYGEGSEEEGRREEGRREEESREEESREEGSREEVSPSNNSEVAIAERAKGDSCDDVDKNLLGEEFLSKKEVCLDLEKRGLLRLLCSGEPEQIGFTFDWYRHSL